MEIARSIRLLNRLHHLLRLPLRRLAAPLLSLVPRFPLTLVAVQDLLLSLALLRCGLLPRTVDLDASTSTSVRLWAPARRRPGKPPLVLIHGFGGDSKWQWHRQIGPLSRSFDVYLPDLVFFGGSRSGSGERSVGFQARCVGEAMRRIGVGQYSVAGISYGGFVAFRMAADAVAGEVERVVVLTAGLCTTAEERNELLDREERDVSEILLPQRPEDLMLLIRRSMYRPPKWMPGFMLRDFIELMYKDQREERLELLKDLLAKGADVNPLPVLNQETLILWGDRDDVFPISLAYQLHRHLGDKARLEVIKDAGHALQLEKPDLINHLIEWFLLDSNELKSS